MADLRGGSMIGGYPIESTKGAQEKANAALQKAIAYADLKVAGNAGTASKLETARTIAISGGATGTATSFDGTGNITIPITELDPSTLSTAVAVSKGGTGLTTLAAGQVLVGNGTSAVSLRAIDTTTGGTTSSTSLITSGAVRAGLDAKSNLVSPTFTGVPVAPTAATGTNTTQLATTAFVTAAVNAKTTITGNAGSATKLATARTIAISGGATGTATSFDGSGDITIPITALDPTKLSTVVAVNKGGTGVATLAAGQVLVGNGTGTVVTRPIDTTTGGTASSTSLITSGAVNGAIGTLSTLKTATKGNLVAAMNEVFQSASDGKTAIATAITNKGITSTVADTFPEMATKIGQIQTGYSPGSIIPKTKVTNYNEYLYNVQSLTDGIASTNPETMMGTGANYVYSIKTTVSSDSTNNTSSATITIKRVTISTGVVDTFVLSPASYPTQLTCTLDRALIVTSFVLEDYLFLGTYKVMTSNYSTINDYYHILRIRISDFAVTSMGSYYIDTMGKISGFQRQFFYFTYSVQTKREYLFFHHLPTGGNWQVYRMDNTGALSLYTQSSGTNHWTSFLFLDGTSAISSISHSYNGIWWTTPSAVSGMMIYSNGGIIRNENISSAIFVDMENNIGNGSRLYYSLSRYLDMSNRGTFYLKEYVSQTAATAATNTISTVTLPETMSSSTKVIKDGYLYYVSTRGNLYRLHLTTLAIELLALDYHKKGVLRDTPYAHIFGVRSITRNADGFYRVDYLGGDDRNLTLYKGTAEGAHTGYVLS